MPIIISAGAVALFFMSLLMLPIFYGANQLFQGAGGNNGNCTDTSQAGSQPQQSAGANAIPANYLALYKQAGQKTGIPWNVLAGIGKMESDHGQSNEPGVHSGANYAGAAGPMQIGIGGQAGNTWGGAPRRRADQPTGGVGVDGNGDGWADVYEPADAIFSAANYLKHSGAPTQMRTAIFAYNHAVWYVDNVLSWAQRYSSGTFTVVQANVVPCSDLNGAPAAPNAIVARAITYAKAQIGKPYIWGGVGPDGYDCSGLMMMAYKSAGVDIPRLSDAQWWWGPRVPEGQEPQQGDLVFFNFKRGHSGPGHVGMVYDPGQHLMIVARQPGTRLTTQNYLDVGAAEGLVGFTRPSDHAGSPKA